MPEPETPEELNARLLEQIARLQRDMQALAAENSRLRARAPATLPELLGFEAGQRDERAQAVAWLWEKSTIHHRLAVEAKKDGDREIASSHLSLSSAYSTAASAFERGEHDQGQPPLNSPPRGE